MKSKVLRNEKGTSIVEFAIILPLLIILIFGMVEFSVLFYDKAVITNASREGARNGILFNADPNNNFDYLPLTCGEIGTKVNDYASDYLITFGTRFDPTITCSPVNGCTASGDTLIVTVSYNYTFLLLPNFLNFLTSPFGLTAITTMRCE